MHSSFLLLVAVFQFDGVLAQDDCICRSGLWSNQCFMNEIQECYQVRAAICSSPSNDVCENFLEFQDCNCTSSLPAIPFCGDGKCSYLESCESCPQDCQFSEDTPCGIARFCTALDPLEKVIALTFDDGPGVHTSQLLDILAEKGVKASFFVLGNNIQANSEVLKRANDEGHLVASHTYRHLNLNTLSEQGILSELLATDDAIQSTLKFTPRFIRPPYGAINAKVESMLESLNFVPVLWNMDTKDWLFSSIDKQNAIIGNEPTGGVDVIKEVAKTLNSSTAYNSFIHYGSDLDERAIGYVPGIIDYLQQLNYRFVLIDECLGKSKEVEPRSFPQSAITKLKLEKPEDGIFIGYVSNGSAITVCMGLLALMSLIN